MNSYEVEVEVSYYATVTVEADSIEDARNEVEGMCPHPEYNCTQLTSDGCLERIDSVREVA